MEMRAIKIFWMMTLLAVTVIGCNDRAQLEAEAAVDRRLPDERATARGAEAEATVEKKEGLTTARGADGGAPPVDKKQGEEVTETKDPAINPTLTPDDLTDAEWKAVLSPEEYRILRHSGTERAGTGRYLENEAVGAYHCAGCGQRLYSAEHKFHSGCGWPSFFKEVDEGAITIYRDETHGMVRTEMRCSRCDGHLGHIFPDAPHQPTGMRHCVNGASLIFVPEGADPQAVLKDHRAK